MSSRPDGLEEEAMSKSLKNVLIGTSLSAESDHVAATGLELARASGARVHLVHAWSPPPVFTGMPAEYVAGGDWWDARRREVEERLKKQAERVGIAAAGGTVALEIGAPHLALLEAAGALAADLIVVGTHEEGDRRWPRLGSTADRLIRKSHSPVLVVRPGAALPPRRVLGPVDFSPTSGAALRRGLALLAQASARRPEVQALFVLNPLEKAGSLQFTPAQITRLASDELNRFVGENVPTGFAHPECRVRTGYPAEEILAELEKWQADLVVLGTHGRSGLERMLIGSVAADVLRRAPCSVLILPTWPETVEAAEEARVGRSADWLYVSDEEPAPVA
jgi:nucleotide-binding universal stress UspA family protein